MGQEATYVFCMVVGHEDDKEEQSFSVFVRIVNNGRMFFLGIREGLNLKFVMK